ncbi:MAG TPA: hypothetical protein VF234_07875 [Limnochordia bacterium]
MRKRLNWILVLGAAVALVFAGVAAAKSTTIVLGNLVLTVSGEVKPKALPKKKLAPITLKLGAKLKTKDGSHPPVLQSFEAELDKDGTLDPKGLPACKQGQLEARTTAAAKKACSKSIIGEGSAEAEVQFPESAPFKAKGPLIVFNGGGTKAKTKIYVHVYANVPAPTAFITPVVVKKIHKGPYGNLVTSRIPSIANGAGSTIKFEITNKKMFRFKGKKKSYFLAKCSKGKFFARGSGKFSDGTRMKGSLITPCKSKG